MSNPIAVELPPESVRVIDPICDAFELAWKQGRRPAIEEYLGSATDAVRGLLLAELIRTELEWRYRLGEEPVPEEYRTRFPECAGSIDDWRSEARTAAEEVSAYPSPDTDDGSVFHTGSVRPGDLPPAQEAPQTLGEYDLLEKLGAGGMGEVYRARHRRLDKRVALKLLTVDSRASRDRLARFLREMKAVGSLDHPNLVEAYDAGEQAGIVYLVMKLIEGTDLGKLVQQRGPLSVAEACDLARQTALGLAYLHERGLVHRDLKPSNLMRTPDGTVKILDLGLARWREATTGEDLTGPGQVMGTPDYLAPEQLRSAATVDIRADLYGLGGTLFYLLTGQAPFAQRRGLYEKLDAHEREQPPDVRSLRPEVPADLAELVGRLLAKKPEERPQTPGEVAAELMRMHDASSRTSPRQGQEEDKVGQTFAPQPALQTPGPPPRRPRVAAARRRWLVAGAGVLVSVLGFIAFALGLFNRQLAPWFGLQQLKAPTWPSEKQSGHDTEEPGDLHARPARVHVESLEVQHFETVQRPEGQFALPRGLLGEQSFAARRNDRVTVEARLSQAAHAYLICFSPDGKEELCFPDSKKQRPPLTDRPCYPLPEKRGENYGLDEGTGLWLFAVVASRKPLPGYEEWRGRLGKSPWRRSEAPAGVVWWDNGTKVVARTADDAAGIRGKGQTMAGKSEVVRLTDWLRQGPDVESAAALGFVVLPKKEP
jgi:serine/threonine protein kinase